jgi:predicted metal-dependent hydrolase
MTPPTILRSRRKTYSIEVRRDGSLVVRAPLRATQAQIEQILAQKASWIQKKQAQVRAAAAARQPRRWVEGEELLFMGNRYPLAIVDGGRPLELRDGRFRLSKTVLPQAERVFERWYRLQARKCFNERAALYAGRNGFVYKQVRIGGARTRWGSCGARGTLNFTWRLVLAPLPVIDYVVVHELAHLEVKNHGRAFWEKVAALMPDYRERRDWLKKNGHLLVV